MTTTIDKVIQNARNYYGQSNICGNVCQVADSDLNVSVKKTENDPSSYLKIRTRLRSTSTDNSKSQQYLGFSFGNTKELDQQKPGSSNTPIDVTTLMCAPDHSFVTIRLRNKNQLVVGFRRPRDFGTRSRQAAATTVAGPSVGL